MTVVGFTGTRAPLACEQRVALAELLAQIDGVGDDAIAFRHGCCVGADGAAVALVRRARNWRVVAHPPSNPYLMDRAALDMSHERLHPEDYLVRNRAIVAACTLLVACPKGPEEYHGSGTWATVREARRKQKRCLVVWPNGDVTHDR